MADTCDVIITSVENPPRVIQALRVEGLDFRSAKALLDNLPNAVVKQGISQQEANSIKVSLEKAGATVELR